jgi:hypothetical protein
MEEAGTASGAAADYESCSTEQLSVAVEQLQALICATQAQLFAVLRVLEARAAYREDGCRDLTAWLVQRCGLSGATARGLAETAAALAELPRLESLLAAGRVSLDQLRPLARVATPQSEEALAKELPGLSAAQAEALARRAAEVDPDDEAAAHRSRRLWLSTSGQTTRLSGSLPLLEGETVRQALERIAARYGPDPESGRFDPFETRLADALVELCGAEVGEHPEPDRADLVIHLDWEVLAGHAGSGETGEGHPLAAETARRAACDSRWRVLTRKLAGERQSIDLGRATRQIPPGLWRYLRLRDGGCRFPGCRGRRLLHGHHLVHWADGGPTDRANLALLCRGCHRRVHEGGWRIEGDAEGALHFVSPKGRRVSGRPAPLREEIRRRLLGGPLPAGPDPPARS